MFSSLKLIKTDRRTRLSCDTLDDLVEIHVEGPSLECFSEEQAVEAWWEDCKSEKGPIKELGNRMLHGKPLKNIQICPQMESQEVNCLSLHEWDTWFNDSDNSNDGELFDN